MKSGSSLYFQIKSEQETEEVNLGGAVIVNEDSATYSRVFIWEGQWFCTCLGNPTNKTTEFLSEESQFITNENFIFFLQSLNATLEEWDLYQDWWRNVTKSLQVLSGFTSNALLPCELLRIEQ